jgi:hypothetical protein
MAINVKSIGKSTPVIRTASVGTTCTQIRGDVGTTVTILASGAIYIFNDVAEGGDAPAAGLRLELSADEASQGIKLSVGRAVVGGRVARRNAGGTICIAAKTGTVSVRVVAER